jgi:hypothetical protein
MLATQATQANERYPAPAKGASRPSRPSRAVPSVTVDPDPLTRGFLTAARALRRYHRHRTFHLDHLRQIVDRDERVVVVCNHALSLTDPLLFLCDVLEELKVMPRTLAHEAGWFKTPLLRDVAAHYGVVRSRDPEAARAALVESGFLFLFPGGASEAALRDYQSEPYRLKWGDRSGFLKLALENDAHLVFVAAVGNDEAYFQSRLQIPRSLLRPFDSTGGGRYFGARLPLGPLGLPLPVQMTHVVSAPLDLGDRKKVRASGAAFKALHHRVWTECQAFLDEAVARERLRSDELDRATRGFEGALRWLGL